MSLAVHFAFGDEYADEVAMFGLIEIGRTVEAWFHQQAFLDLQSQGRTNQWLVCLGQADCVSRLFLGGHVGLRGAAVTHR